MFCRPPHTFLCKFSNKFSIMLLKSLPSGYAKYSREGGSLYETNIKTSSK